MVFQLKVGETVKEKINIYIWSFKKIKKVESRNKNKIWNGWNGKNKKKVLWKSSLWGSLQIGVQTFQVFQIKKAQKKLNNIFNGWNHNTLLFCGSVSWCGYRHLEQSDERQNFNRTTEIIDWFIQFSGKKIHKILGKILGKILPAFCVNKNSHKILPKILPNFCVVGRPS